MNIRTALLSIASFLLFASSVFAANRAKIDGRDGLLDGQPHIPHGMTHLALDQLPELQRMGINSLSVDLAFSNFDPQRSDAENEKAMAGVIALADSAHEHGMTILWLFSFHYTPNWLWERYPDVRMKQYDGADGAGGWMQMCLDHPGFRTDADKWLAFTVARLQKRPATIGYILWNEPHLTGTVDYNPYTIAAFRAWLINRYSDVNRLNEAWQTRLESIDAVEAPPPQTGTHWHQIYDNMVNESAGATTNEVAAEGMPNPH